MANTKPPPSTTPAVLFENGMFLMADQTNGNVSLFSSAGTRVASWNTAGRQTVSNSITVVGQGYPLIVATSVQSAVTNVAPATLTFTPPTVAGTYRITSQLNATTATTLTFKNILGYTDSTGAARTDKPVWERQASATMLADPTANTADRFVQPPFLFSIDASGTAITLGDNTGTYTTCIYDYTVILERLI